MRIAAMIAAGALAACGPSTQSSDDVPSSSDGALPFGPIYAVGQDWTLNANPADNTISFYAEDGTEASGAWSPPAPVEGGHRIVAGDITLDLQQAACTLFDTPYPMAATVTAAGKSFTGCAAMRWDYQLIALMPQIDACIAQRPDSRWITYAGETAPGEVIVRMRGGDALSDCRVSNGAATIRDQDGNTRYATDNAVIFVRGPGDNPGGECYDAPEVRGANNELLGWRVDPLGC